MSSIKYCSITAGKNICGVCWKDCYFDPRNPVNEHVKELAMMQLFRCGHAVCTPCFYKMSGLKLCSGKHCNRLYETATQNCEDCDLNLCDNCACFHDNAHKDDLFVFENNNIEYSYYHGRSWKNAEHEYKPFSCPFCRDGGSSFSAGFGSSRRVKPSNTISQYLYEFCGNNSLLISSLVKGQCTHPYLVMLRKIKKDAAEKKRVKVAKRKKAIQTAEYLSRKASMSVEQIHMVKDRKEKEDAKKPKLCESSILRKPLTPLYTERNRNKKQGKCGKMKWVGNLHKMIIAKKRIEKRLKKLSYAKRGKKMKDAKRELRSITGKMRKLK